MAHSKKVLALAAKYARARVKRKNAKRDPHVKKGRRHQPTNRYFTVIIPWVESYRATKWHPTEKTGPFSTLSRGAFETRHEAHTWAKSHLGGSPYRLREIVGGYKRSGKLLHPARRDPMKKDVFAHLDWRPVGESRAKISRPKLTAAQKKCLKEYNFALSQEDRYLGSVFVTPAGQRRVEAVTKAAHDRCVKLGMGHEHGL